MSNLDKICRCFAMAFCIPGAVFFSATARAGLSQFGFSTILVQALTGSMLSEAKSSFQGVKELA